MSLLRDLFEFTNADVQSILIDIRDSEANFSFSVSHSVRGMSTYIKPKALSLFSAGVVQVQ